jgi:hypothetical protein
MAYPIYVLATLESVYQGSCGTLQQRMIQVDGANPPEFRKDGTGDFTFARLLRVDLGGGNYTWDLMFYRPGSGNCDGLHGLRRTEAADDPTGNFCGYSGGVMDCAHSQASVVDDD